MSGDQGVASQRLLASAIAGRPVEVSMAGTGEPSWTDGATVFVEPGLDQDGQRLAVALQAAMLAAGSFDPVVMRAMVRRPSLARRYLAVEAHRALGQLEPILPLPVRRLMDRPTADRSDSPAHSLELARLAGAPSNPPAIFGAINPSRLRSSVEQVQQGDAAHRHAPSPGRDTTLRELDDDADEGPALDALSSPVGGGGSIGRLLKRLFGDARSDGGGPPGVDSPTHWGTPRRPTVGAVVSTRTAPSVDGVPVDAERSFTYPEWDRSRRAYKLDWCTVIEPEPAATQQPVGAVPNTHALRRALGRLGVEFERRHRQLSGDDVDIDAAVDAHVQWRAGQAADEAVYIDSVRARRDLSVLVLLDVSGSAGEPSATGVPVHVHQRAAAAALTVTLHELGDRVALYGFRSQGRHAVHLTPVKRFGGSVDEGVHRRLQSLEPGAYTRLGAAIRHGTAVLERDTATARRLLVVLSDGFAYDHGYEPHYGEGDARRALAEARRRGVGCLCLSIGAATDADALARVFGSAAYAAVARVEQLPAVVGPLLHAALRTAETQRRLFTRRERSAERLGLERRTA